MDVKGVDQVLAEMQRLAAQYPRGMAEAIYAEATAIEAASVKLVPVDTGHLRQSHFTTRPIMGASGPECTIGYGTDYALPVHERLEAFHPVGQAKYLETPFKWALSGMAERLAARVKQWVAGGSVALAQGTQSYEEAIAQARGEQKTSRKNAITNASPTRLRAIKKLLNKGKKKG
jgi:hypothetical protein